MSKQQLKSESLNFVNQSVEILKQLNYDDIANLIESLAKLKKSGGRLLILGVGGSAGTASHAVNDFRKICGIETYTPVDNVSELTARANDEGFSTIFEEWLKVSKLSKKDAVFILSVGGGNAEKNISVNLIKAIDYAKSVNAKVFGIVGRDGGYTKQNADVCFVIPPLYPDKITPQTEGLCSLILHLLVSSEALKSSETKWESAVK